MPKDVEQLELVGEKRGEAPKAERSGEAGRPLALIAGGEWPHMARPKRRCRISIFTNSASRVLQRTNLNTPNRRMRPRMSGGVGGEPRG